MNILAIILSILSVMISVGSHLHTRRALTRINGDVQ